MLIRDIALNGHLLVHVLMMIKDGLSAQRRLLRARIFEKGFRTVGREICDKIVASQSLLEDLVGY